MDFKSLMLMPQNVKIIFRKKIIIKKVSLSNNILNDLFYCFLKLKTLIFYFYIIVFLSTNNDLELKLFPVIINGNLSSLTTPTKFHLLNTRIMFSWNLAVQ